MPVVAYNYASKNKQRMEDAIRLSRRLGLIIAGISVVLYELFATQFTRLFISDPQTVEMAAQFLQHPCAGHAADVFEFFHGLFVPGFRKGTYFPVFGRDPVAGV